jgi:dihydrodipicolinate synthase/N-acetylneuraminate lyase
MRKVIKSIIPPMVTPFNDRERIEKNGHPRL